MKTKGRRQSKNIVAADTKTAKKYGVPLRFKTKSIKGYNTFRKKK